MTRDEVTVALYEALRLLDVYVDFSTPIQPGEWGVVQPAGINAAFMKAVNAISAARGAGVRTRFEAVRGA